MKYYGGDGTIHQTGHVDVELTEGGRVCSVWFRCAMLPFEQHHVSAARALQMDQAYKTLPKPIVSVEFKEPPKPRYTAEIIALSYQHKQWAVLDNGLILATYDWYSTDSEKNAKEYAEWLNSKARRELCAQ